VSSFPSRRITTVVVLAVLAIGSVAAVLVAPGKAEESLGQTGIKGAGSTFAYSIVSRWSLEYRDWLLGKGDLPVSNSGLDDPSATSALEYEPVGSLAGTLRLKERAVDFGASDMPMSSEELSKLGIGQFPIVIGGVVVAVNIEGLAAQDLRLTGPVLAQIFLGTIERWSDPALQALNPTLKLPAAKITVVHRSDGSGTTFNFTDYLSKVSPEWKQKVGSGLLVPWPRGMGAKGNEGIADAVKASKNSIGYLDYAHAHQLELRCALIQNRAGRFVRAETASFQAAAANADWARAHDFQVALTDLGGTDAYPITATVFALLHVDASPSRIRTTLEFFRWSLDHGSTTAVKLGYVPLPPALVQQVKAYWTKTFKIAL
jgi:phosphate transport system substrate-binding protein